MVNYHRQGLLQLTTLVFCGSVSSAFTGAPRQSATIRPPNTPKYLRRQFIRESPNKVPSSRLRRGVLTAKIDGDEASYSMDEQALIRSLESNNLEKILSFLQTHSTSIRYLTQAQIQRIFDAIEVATTESDDNTVNKRAIEDANIVSASGGSIEFRSLDRVRDQMTKLYNLLREEGMLNAFGAIGRPPPSPMQMSALPTPDGPIYPTSGSKIITPKLLEEITNIDMVSLTPQPTNLLLYGGAALAVIEGIASLYYGINFNLLVVCTILLALMDQLLVSGAVFETALRIAKPEMTSRITKHEAGHFLCAYLLGCPVEGVVLSTWAAIADSRFGGRSSRAVSAGTSYYDLDLSEQISGMKPLTRESIDRYSIIVMGGIAAEAVEFGRADGGAGDEEALVRFLRSLNPRSSNAVSTWNPDLIKNQARWGATQAVLLLKEYKPCYDALVDALERGGELGQCVVAIEEAAAREGLGWLHKPLGVVLEEGEFGKWAEIGEEKSGNGGTTDLISGDMSQSNSNGASTMLIDKTAGVPTYGEDSITSTEEFLKKYRDVMEKKLASIDEKLEEMDNKNSVDS
mmetsp:Transcript_4886/g.12259  ORF Transcript_4886/g.12259 Transcript_4886/m.12259 type:complete len:573 (+) Transcript_4886:164-1882(+)